MSARYPLAKQTGFTIVELLIVIVVIAILATISIVAYSGIQARARDSQIRLAASQIEKAIIMYSTKTGLQPYGGGGTATAISGVSCPGATSVSGWFGKGQYTCTLEEILVANGDLSENLIASLPPNKVYNSPQRTFMVYRCGSPANSYGLYWYLESPTSNDATNLDNVLSTCGTSTTLRDSYGMRAGKIIQL